MPEIGNNFLRYKIISLIGSGGMGDVYLARDTQLDRKVAIKILKPKYSHLRHDGLQRFVLEARSASALNHPNIITIYDIGEAEGSNYIASEFVDGKTLHQKMGKTGLPLGEVLNIAVQIAEALTAAHSAGIIHRDIKPENVMVRGDGYVKVLDFGLAKLTEPTPQSADVEADTWELIKTNPGMVMGTVSYMSPEQARGRPVDARSDIWSLGVVMYEMVTGKRPFSGETTSDVIAAVLKTEPEPIPDAPSELERIINKTLRKDREQRYQHIKDLLIDLKDFRQEIDTRMRSDTASFTSTNGDKPALSTGDANKAVLSTAEVDGRTHSISELFLTQFRLHPLLLTAIVAASLIVVAAASYIAFRSYPWGKPPGFQSMSFSKLTSVGNVVGGQVALSPDGKYFAYVSKEPGGQSLWVKQTTTSSGVQLAPAAAVQYNGLTFSRDGSYIFYSAAEQGSATPAIYKIPTLGGDKRRLVNDADGPISLSPHGDRFAFVRDESSLMIANEDGGDPKVLATSDKGNAWWLPVWSPDGKRIVSGLYMPQDNMHHLVEVAVDSGKVTEIASPAWPRINGLTWLPNSSGLLVCGRAPDDQFFQVWKLSYPDGKLSKVTNDATTYEGLSIAGDGNSAVSVQINRLLNIWIADESNLSAVRQITTETGRDEGLSGAAWTPDGGILYTTRIHGSQDIWSVKRDGSENRQLTFNAKSNFSPAVSPDGRFIVFTSTRSGDPNIWRANRDGSDPVQLTSDPGIEGHPTISPDGKWVFYHLEDANKKLTIWKVSIDGGTAVRITDAESSRPEASPDGQTIAFKYGPTAPGEAAKIALMPTDGSGNIRQLNFPAVAGSKFFRWSSDGRSLIYVDGSAGPGRVWSQPLVGGEPKLLAEFKDKQIYAIDVSSRGSGIVLSFGAETSEALMITNF